MGDVGQGAVEGLPLEEDLAGIVLFHPQFVGRDDRVCAGDERGADEEERHDQGGREHEAARVGDPRLFVVGIFITAADEVDQQDAGLEAREPQRQLGKDQQRDPQGHPQALTLERRLVEVVGTGGDLRKPLLEQRGVGEEMPQPADDDQERKTEKDDDEDRGDAHHLGVALEEHRPQEQQEHHRHDDLVVGPRGGVPGEDRVADEMRRGIGGGERLRDHEVGGGKTDQHEDADLSLPAAHEPLNHPDRADAVGGLAGDVAVDGVGPEERHEDEDQRCEGGEGASPFEGDRRLVAEGAEVVDAAQAHDQPPRVVVMLTVGRLTHGGASLLQGDRSTLAVYPSR